MDTPLVVVHGQTRNAIKTFSAVDDTIASARLNDIDFAHSESVLIF